MPSAADDSAPFLPADRDTADGHDDTMARTTPDETPPAVHHSDTAKWVGIGLTLLSMIAATIGFAVRQDAQNDATAKALDEVTRAVNAHVSAPAHPVEATQVETLVRMQAEQAATLRSLDERSRRVDVNVAVLCASSGRRCEH